MSISANHDGTGWTFTVEEVSMGVYLVTAIDRAGRCVQMTGADPDELLEQARAAACEINADVARNHEQRD